MLREATRQDIHATTFTSCSHVQAKRPPPKSGGGANKKGDAELFGELFG